jgi:long-subunit fatty acid transport protein
VLASVGARYAFKTSGIVLDVSWLHQFVKDASVNVSVPGVPGALRGRFENSVDIVSIQLTKSF